MCVDYWCHAHVQVDELSKTTHTYVQADARAITAEDATCSAGDKKQIWPRRSKKKNTKKYIKKPINKYAKYQFRTNFDFCVFTICLSKLG